MSTGSIYAERTAVEPTKSDADGQAGSTPTPVADKFGFTLGLGQLSIAGFALAVVLAAFLAWSKWTAADITSVVSPFIGLLGTLIAAFFGIKVGEQGKEKVEREVEKEQQKVEQAEQKVEKERQQVLALRSAATPDVILKAQEMNPLAFR